MDGRCAECGGGVEWIQTPTAADKDFVLPTGETVLGNLYRDEIRAEEDLPKKFIA